MHLVVVRMPGDVVLPVQLYGRAGGKICPLDNKRYQKAGVGVQNGHARFSLDQAGGARLVQVLELANQRVHLCLGNLAV